MTLALTVDKIDSVPEAVRSLYVEKEGKFHLDVDGLPDVTGLKNTVEATRKERDTFADQIKQWAKLGKKPEEVDAMLTAERQKTEEALLKAGKFDEVLAKHLGDAKVERDTAVGVAEKKAESALGIARRAIVGNNVANALVKGKATDEGMEILPRILGERIKIDFADDGTETVSILEADGKTPMVGSGKEGLATFDDLVKEATKKFPSLFAASGAGGGGTPPKGGKPGEKQMPRAEWDKLGPFEQAAKIKEGFRPVD